VTFWFFTKSDAENRQLTCQKTRKFKKSQTLRRTLFALLTA
jgi:hypothetical protein